METAQTLIPEGDLYEPVRRHEQERRRSKDSKVALTVMLLLVFFVGMIMSFWWFMSYWDRYYEMCSKLSDCTELAYRKHTATVDDGAGVYSLSDENVYKVYQCACIYGPGRERFTEPEGEVVTVSYGVGSYVRLISVGEGEDERLYFSFHSADGFTHTFYTSDISLDYLMKRYLSRDNQ